MVAELLAITDEETEYSQKCHKERPEIKDN